MVERKTELKEKKLNKASLEELRCGHYGYPYFGFSLFSFFAIAILSIIYY